VKSGGLISIIFPSSYYQFSTKNKIGDLALRPPLSTPLRCLLKQKTRGPF